MTPRPLSPRTLHLLASSHPKGLAPTPVILARLGACFLTLTVFGACALAVGNGWRWLHG